MRPKIWKEAQHYNFRISNNLSINPRIEQTSSFVVANHFINKLIKKYPLMKYIKGIIDFHNQNNSLVASQSEDGKILQRDGIVVIENFIDEAQVSSLKEKIEKAIHEFPHNQKINQTNSVISVRDSHDSKNKYDTGMIDFVNADEIVKELSEFRYNERITQILSEAANQTMLSASLHVYINKNVTNTRVFHIDTFYPRQYKAFIYLTDVNSRDDGPYTYIKKSQAAPVSKFISVCYNLLKGYPVTDSRIKFIGNPTYLLGKKGTLILSCQNGMHRGWPQSEGAYRMAMVNYFYPGK